MKHLLITAAAAGLVTVLFITLYMNNTRAATRKDLPSEDTKMQQIYDNKNIQTIYLAGGCFWGMEKLMRSLRGIVNVTAGYANGKPEIEPNYKLVSTGTTGYKETVKVDFNPDIIPLGNILNAYFFVIDPTLKNQQGPDKGPQYQTGIYYVNAEQEQIINQIAAEQKAKHKNFVVEIEPLSNFFPAEEYHQDYLTKNPGGYCHISAGAIQQCAAKYSGEIQKFAFTKPTQNELKQKLTPQQYEVTQNSGTEPPFKNKYWDFYEKGIYVDIVTGEPLFTSEQKFKSSCGWPSFSETIKEDAVVYKQDNTHGMQRTEVRSKEGDSHLGHIFTGDPHSPNGVRYCMNSAAMRFIPYDDLDKEGYGYLKDKFNK